MQSAVRTVLASIKETLTSNFGGISNLSLENFHPLAITIGLFNLLNQSGFGTTGLGIAFIINFMLYTSYIFGMLMGKTPEIFGKKLEKQEIMISLTLLLIKPLLILTGTALTLIIHPNYAHNTYEHIHYYTRVIFEFASSVANNGLELKETSYNSSYWNTSQGIVMLLSWYCGIALVLSLASSLANKPKIPETIITLKTDTFLFGLIFLLLIVISTLLIYIPFIIPGPLAEILIHC